jgi:DNA-binding transcriptional MerR regulator
MKAVFEFHASPAPEGALTVFQAGLDETYTLDAVAHLAQISRHRVALYCKHGLIVPVSNPADEGWFFDAEAIRTLRELERFRDLFGANLHGVRLLLELSREVEELRRELRFHRGV